MCMTVKMSDNPISGIQLFNTYRTRHLDRFFLEMPGATQREIVTDDLSCLSKKKMFKPDRVSFGFQAPGVTLHES